MEIQKTCNEFWIIGCVSRGNRTFIPFPWTFSGTRNEAIHKIVNNYKENWETLKKAGYMFKKVKLEFRE